MHLRRRGPLLGDIHCNGENLINRLSLKKLNPFFHPEGVRQQVPAERERRAVFGAALRDLVPVRDLSLPTPLHADNFHRFQKVIHALRWSN